MGDKLLKIVDIQSMNQSTTSPSVEYITLVDRRIYSFISFYNKFLGHINFVSCYHFITKFTIIIWKIFPFTNTGYYDSQNTTDRDLIEFEAGVSILDQTSTETNNKVDMGIMLNGTQDWTSTVSLLANESVWNVSTESSMKLIACVEYCFLNMEK
jgi:hypothetical protein